MRNTRLGDKIKQVLACVPSAGAATAMTAVVVDGTGYNRALYTLATGAQATGGTMTLKITESDASGGSYADITSAALANLGASSGSKVYTLDIPVNPAKPFQKIAGTIGTDTIANAIICTLYRPNESVKYPISTAYATQAIIV